MADKPTIFVDANVFLEVLWKQKGWKSSLRVLEKVRKGKLRGYVSVLSTAIIYFFLSQDLPRSKALSELRKGVGKFELCDNTAKDAEAALKDKRFSDFEDALQFYSAISVSKIMITRNKKDFKAVSREIEVLTPEEFLKNHHV
ncbi:MAG: PIN domain-containing protein [Thaumarchaeota archaeon]|nr:PIN domain-containing protein [Nitrososphaerota archaeon]